MSDTPLAGVRVLELARILAGPWAGQVLADLGADVLKVESPSGDDTRTWGPPFVERRDGSRDAAYFHATNRGKRSCVIDFSTKEGADRVRALAADADVVIENFKVGGLAKYGLDFASIAAINPRIVYCSITGFGQSGPYAARPGYDFIIQGMGGLMDVTGEPDGPPQKAGVAFADIFTGLYSVIAIQAALRTRDTTGVGQHIDMALLDSMTGVLANQGLNYLASGTSPQRLGNCHPNIAPYETYPAKDGWVIIAVGNDDQFVRLGNALGLPDVAADTRFATNPDRVANREALSMLVGKATCLHAREALLQTLEAAGVPCGPINSVADALTHPQIDYRGMRLSMRDGADGPEVPGIATPIRFSESPLAEPTPAPALGSATDKWR